MSDVFSLRLLEALGAYFDALPPASAEPLVVAFSGGPDSTALLWGLRQLGRHRLIAAHLDHGLDSRSEERAAAAATLSASLGVEHHSARRPVAPRHRESLEEAARRTRYAYLEDVRRQVGGRWVATGHHRDDQAETVLLRILYGSGLSGLAGVQPRWDRLIRPLLILPRATLVAAVAEARLEATSDPGNLDLRRPRNRIRHHLLPALAQACCLDPAELAGRLARLAARAAGANRRIAVCSRQAAGLDGASADLAALRSLPDALLVPALQEIHRLAGAGYPPGRSAIRELERQLRGGGPLRCDAGSGWQWHAQAGRLRLIEARKDDPSGHFSYKLSLPGELRIRELGLRIRLRQQPVEDWMLRGEPTRAGLALPLREGACVTIRNRLPGDRLHPLGASGSRRLKEIFIDRRVPRSSRERWPLLCVGERIAWVPGVTIDESFRLGQERIAWVAELEPDRPAVAAWETVESLLGPRGFHEARQGVSDRREPVGSCPSGEVAEL